MLSTPSSTLPRSSFPEGFLFGVATSSYQIEGHAYGGAGATHWDTFAATPGNVVRQENGRIACDHYHRYGEDLDLVHAAGFDIYRFSTSWARILPDGIGDPNAQGLDYYDRLIDAMLERGLKPAATLYHWELPASLADIGGWRNRDIPLRFADFTALVADRYGDRLWSVAPINEPWCVGWLSHFLGLHAPGLRDIRAAARAMHHVLLGHGLAIGVMRDAGMTNLGAVCNFQDALAASDTDADKEAAAREDAIYNHFFLSGLFHGTYPDRVLDGITEHLPKDWELDFPTIQNPLDWIGVNYYTCSRIAHAEGPWPHTREVPGPLEKTAMDWEIRPASLSRICHLVASYCPDLPIYITENGLASYDTQSDGQVADPQRIAFIRDHLREVETCLEDGLDIRGYIIWSLLDNFEWALGYEKRFGLVHVDFETLARTPKQSYHAIRQFLEGATL